MAEKYLYNLYDTWDDDRIALANATLAEIMDFTGLKNIKIGQYIDKGDLLCKRYRPQKAESCEKRSRNGDGYGKFTTQMYREWTTMNERYGNKRKQSSTLKRDRHD